MASMTCMAPGVCERENGIVCFNTAHTFITQPVQKKQLTKTLIKSKAEILYIAATIELE